MTLAAENILRSGILGPDKYILVMHGEMESSVYPWQSVCQRTGAILHVIPPPDDNTSWTTAIKTTIDSLPHNSIAVIILTCVHWCSGRSIDPIGEIFFHFDFSHSGQKFRTILKGSARIANQIPTF